MRLTPDRRLRPGETIEPWRNRHEFPILALMPEIPTYRVTGEDWDTPEPHRLEAVRERLATSADGPAADEEPGATAGPAAAARSAPSPPSPSTTEPGGWRAVPASEPGFHAGPAGSVALAASGLAASGVAVGTLARTRLLEVVGRLAPGLVPTVERVPARLLLGGGVVVIAAVAMLFLGSGRPANVVATATAGPTVLVAAPTPSCPAVGAVVSAPIIEAESPSGGSRLLVGFEPTGGVDLDAPWPAELEPVEATIELGSSLTLSAPAACIREWRAIAAHPPASTAQAWRPDEPETLQLGWQKADRIGWQPNVPLPPRGEWLLRVTVWYRDATPAEAGASEPAGTPPPELVVERYFRLTVEAPGS